MKSFVSFALACVLAYGGTCAAQSVDLRVRTVTDDVFEVVGTDGYLMTRTCDVRVDAPIGASVLENGRDIRFESGQTCRLTKRLKKFTPPVGRHPSKITQNYDGVYTFWKLKLYAISLTQSLLTMGADGALIVHADGKLEIDFDGVIVPASLVLKEAL